MNEIISKWKKAKEDLSQKLKRMPTDSDIAKKLKLPQKKIEHINFWLSASTSSLEAPVGDDGESHVMDLIEDESAQQPDAHITRMLNKERVDNLLGQMSEKEREVLDMRFGLRDGKPHTLAEVAQKLDVSRERIRQIEKEALEKLRTFVNHQENEE